MIKIYLKTWLTFLLIPGLIFISYSCKKKAPLIILTTKNISGITQVSAESGGVIKAENWDYVIARGVCWSTTENPTTSDNKSNNGNDTGSFVSKLTGLKPGIIYYLRAYAMNKADTVYGNTISFSTQNYGTLTDIEGNTYKTITIGTQIWMAENLRTKKYNDGIAIPLVTNETGWAELTTPGYCWYKNEEETFKESYGALYNWYSINTGKLCPLGWHASADEEWNSLITCLGGEGVAGGKLKETGVDYWVDPNIAASNESGFSALPGGFRYYDGKFFDFGFSGYWWASGEYSQSRAYFRLLSSEDSVVFRFDNVKKNGFSVRCVKD